MLSRCVEVKSPRNLTVNTIVTRIDANRERYEKKFEKKRKEETAYYDARYAREGSGTVHPSGRASTTGL